MKATGLPGNIVLCFFLLTNLQAKGQWFWQNPLPQGNSLNTVSFKNINLGFAGGDCGTILKTVNSGMAWTLTSTETLQNIKDIQMVNEVCGFAAGGNSDPENPEIMPSAILKTNDGGESWTTIFSDTNGQFFSLFFTSPEVGYVAGNQGRIMKTINGGESWISLQTGTSKMILSVWFLDDNYGYATGNDNLLLMTDDAGNTWKQKVILSTDIDFIDIEFTSQYDGFLVGNHYDHSTFNFNTYVFKTINSGSSWIQVYIKPHFRSTQAVFADENHGYIAGPEGMLSTQDGGQNWSFSYFNSYSSHVGISFPAVDTGFATWGSEHHYIGSSAITRTDDGGSTWVDLTIAKGFGFLVEFDFPEPAKGFALYRYELLKTVDGGYHWDSVTSVGYMEFFKACDFVSPDYGFLLVNKNQGYDQKSFVMKTIDGGQSWTTDSLPQEIGNCNGLSVCNTDTVFIGGYNITTNSYHLIRSDNGGLSWNLVTDFLSLGIDVQGFEFINRDIGYLFGVDVNNYDLRFLRTSDGGASWNRLLELDNYYPVGMKVFNADSCLLMATSNSENLMIRTFDGGNSLQIRGLSTIPRIGHFDFFSPDHGVCASVAYNTGEIYRTSDGGLTWQVEWTGSCFPASPLLMTSPDTIYTGTIFAYSTSSILCNAVGTIVGDPPFPEMVIDDKDFILVPNPADDKVTLSFEESPGRMLTIDLYNLLGQPVQHFMTKAGEAGDNLITLDVAGLPEGIYIVYLSSVDSQRTSKVIIRH